MPGTGEPYIMPRISRRSLAAEGARHTAALPPSNAAHDTRLAQEPEEPGKADDSEYSGRVQQEGEESR